MERKYIFFNTGAGCLSSALGCLILFIFVVFAAFRLNNYIVVGIVVILSFLVAWVSFRIDKGKESLKKSTIILWIIVLALIILGVLLLPNVAAMREQSRRVNNLKHLNAVYKSLSHWGLRPEKLENMTDPKADYVVVTNNLAGNDLNENKVLIFSKPECFPGKGGNVVFASGSGKWCDLDEYNRLTKGLIPAAP